MTSEGAHTAVTTSALVVGGIFLYRHLIEPEIGSGKHGKAHDLLTGGDLPTVPEFVVAWGFVFLVLSIAAEAVPQLGGWAAILIATGAVLNNGQRVVKDMNNTGKSK